MKKLLAFCIVFITAVYLYGFSVRAHNYESASAEIETEIKLGGHVIIIPDDNCPVPSKTEVELNDGETGRFDISLTTVGAYGYTVKLIPDDRDLIFDQTVYRVKIYVDDAEGKLAVTYIVTKGDHKYDSKRLVFVNNAPKPDKPPHGPKTDDNSRTKTAFLFALIVAAGSLAISIYLTDRKKKNI